MNFLIDECLHTSLVAVARARDHQATHVVWRGLGGAKDWDLMAPILREDLTLVTNNARDFRRLFAQAPLHAGLVILIPNVAPALQRALFDAVLDELESSVDLTNQALEVRLQDQTVLIERYDLPAARE